MNPVHLTLVFFILCLLFTILSIVVKTRISPEFLKTILKFVIIAVLAFSAKFPFYHSYFFGLEYEDSYVYTAYARSLLYYQDFSNDPYLTTGCTNGSLENCSSISTYSGHLIGFPSVIYLMYFLFGYSPHTALYLGLVFSILSALLVYLLTKSLSTKESIALLAAGIYSITPIMSVFHSSGLSETFSSFFLLLFLYHYFSYLKTKLNNKHTYVLFIQWSAILTVLFFAMLVKRENLILFLVPIISIIYFTIKEKSFNPVISHWPFTIVIVAVLLLYRFGINLNTTIEAEIPDVNGFPFNYKFFLVLFPLFLKSLFSFSWFSVFTPFCIMGVIYIIVKHNKNIGMVIITILFLTYLLLYTSHYRSYYFIRQGNASTFETLRYITTFFPLYCILSSLSLIYFFEKFKRIKSIRVVNYSIIVLLFLFSTALVYQGHALKRQFSAIEFENRVDPVLISASYLKQNAVVVTSEPLLFQIFCNPDLSIINFYSIGCTYDSETFSKLLIDRQVYFLKKSFQDDPIEIERNPESYRLLNTYKHTIIKQSKGFTLLRIYNNEL